MKLVFVTLVLSFLSKSIAYKHQQCRLFATKLKGNKVDGISIDGSLMPLSNNLMIKVKLPDTATAG
jgi:hypothetical protein